MTERVVRPKTQIAAFPAPSGDDIPERIFEADQVVTGEAVALDIRPAGMLALIGCGVIDLATTFVLTLAAIIFLTAIGSDALAASGTFLILAIVIAVIIIPAIVETLTQGRSLGRWAMGVQIVRDDGGPIRFRHAIVRSLVGVLEIYATFGAIAMFSSLTNPRQKRLGDFLAGTYPVKIENMRNRQPPLIMPPDLVEWAARVDVTRLPGSLAWQTQQFLNQAHGMDASTRATYGQRYANQVARYVASPPPMGTHPERFLAAVLVLRRDAEYLSAVRAESELAARFTRPVPYGMAPTAPPHR